MFDASYEPIVVDSVMYLSSAQNDSVTAIDTKTGEEKWQFFAEAPIRFAPVASKGRLYFGSDDGCMYCVGAEDGSLIWKFDTADSVRNVLGNDRLVSVWPVRGGPVLSADGKLYFTAGVWPFEGTFLYTLDAESGEQLDKKDGTPPEYSVLTLTDMTPQGYLVLSGKRLFIPCGRAAVGIHITGTNFYKALGYNARGLTDYHATASGPYLFHGHRIIDMDANRTLPISAPRPVSDGSEIYLAQSDNVVAADILKQPEPDPKELKKGILPKFKATWHVSGQQILDALGPVSATRRTEGPLTVDIKAGNRVYGRYGNVVYAAEGPGDGKRAAVSWASVVDGTPASLLAADDRLFVATSEGKILCYGAEKGAANAHPAAEARLAVNSQSDKVTELLEKSDQRSGYCLVLGVEDGKTIDELVRQSDLSIIAVDNDPQKISRLRNRYDELGLYGNRVVALVGEPLTFSLPPYLANLIVSEVPQRLVENVDATKLQALFRSLRPYGGTAALTLTEAQHQSLEPLVGDLSRANFLRDSELTLLSRDGALEGAANWSHEYGDPANSLMSQDKRVKLPLGVLWFGGPASATKYFFDRHFWGPSLTVIDGRMFLQGHTTLAAVDIYTGRILWEKTIIKGSSPGRRGNFYDGDHHTGYHFCAVEDAIYLAYADSCLKINPISGKTMAKFILPNPSDRWGRIRVWNDLLVVSVFDTEKHEGSVPTRLVAMDRQSGKIAWTHQPEASCPIVAIGKKHLYYFDGQIEALYNDIGRAGVVPKTGPTRKLRAIDAATGKEVWSQDTPMVITWLAHSEDHDVLVASNHEKVQARRGASGEVLWDRTAKSKGFLGHPESRWDRVILWNDKIIDQRGPGVQYFIETGEPIQINHPISGEPVNWEFTAHGHHCNYAIANEHMMTFRAGSAGFTDLKTVGTGRFKGFRTGCRNSLIPAGGILNAPNFGHGCTCSYSLFTSLALTHLPEMDTWSYSAMTPPEGPVSRVGINLAAPGDRQADNGTLWLDYPARGEHNYRLPNVSGPSPDVPVSLVGSDLRWFRQHPSQLEGKEEAWVAASGVEGLQSITIDLGEEVREKRAYQVRLYFAEPHPVTEGERVFHIAMEGNRILENFDVVKESGGPKRIIVKQFDKIEAGSDLTIELTPVAGQTLLCGIEVVAEE